jgi:CMP/dCMP kinase
VSAGRAGARRLVIAIDGPAGAGKSTVGRAVAGRLGLQYLDTGAMYRAVAFAALRRGIPVTDDAAVAELARVLELAVSDDGVVVVDGVDATREIRGREVTAAVSAVAANTPVREELRARQRQWADDRGGGVIEGRDIGSVVFPDATLKLFVTASPRVRAERRVAELGGDVDEVAASIAERDRRDMTRADGPLVAADGATVVDTTGLTIDEVVDRIVELLAR